MTNLFSKQAQREREVCANPRGREAESQHGDGGADGNACPWSSQRGVGTTQGSLGQQGSWPSHAVQGRVKQVQASSTRQRTCSYQGHGTHPGQFCPAVKPAAREAGEGSAGVCSGRNRASIDLLLLKPELLSGTLQPGCPHACFLERAILCALAGGVGPPKYLDAAPGSGGSRGRSSPAGTGAGGTILCMAPTSLLPVALSNLHPSTHHPSTPAPSIWHPVLPTGLRAALAPQSVCWQW